MPGPMDVCTSYDWQIDKDKFPDYDLRTLTNLMTKMAERHGIFSINLFKVFQGERCHELYYHHGNNYWTPLGQKLAATMVADHLIQDETLHLSSVPPYNPTGKLCSFSPLELKKLPNGISLGMVWST